MKITKTLLRPERLREVPEQFSWVDQALVHTFMPSCDQAPAKTCPAYTLDFFRPMQPRLRQRGNSPLKNAKTAEWWHSLALALATRYKTMYLSL